MEFFGFEFKRKVPQQTKTITVPQDDGSVNVSSSFAYYSQVVDIDNIVKNENRLVSRYRDLAMQPEVDEAINEIVNEAITISNGESVSIDFKDNNKLSNKFKRTISEEFEQIKNLLQFDTRGYDIFRRWYIDGRIHYLVLLDENNPKAGIRKLEYIDSKKIRKVRDVKKKRDPKTGVDIIEGINEYFIFNDKGFDSSSTQGVKLSSDAVIYVTSGLIDGNTNIVLSYLHKAIKPANQLKMMEDAVVIYRISRAPERRVFYIDVGNLPKMKADQFMADIMNKYRNKIVYDAATGEVRDDRKFTSMLEDFWIPRREGGRGTEITTLPGGQSLGQIDDVEYFKQKLYRSLNVPVTRLLPQDGFSLGRAAEISRDEIKFAKFIDRLRAKFSELFLQALRVQLIAKNIIRVEEWDEICKYISFRYPADNNFAELRDAELMQLRLSLLNGFDSYVDKWVSRKWVMKNILRFTEVEMQQIEDEIRQNAQTGVEQQQPFGVQQYAPPIEQSDQTDGEDVKTEQKQIDDEMIVEQYDEHKKAEIELMKKLAAFLESDNR